MTDSQQRHFRAGQLSAKAFILRTMAECSEIQLADHTFERVYPTEMLGNFRLEAFLLHAQAQELRK